MSDPTTHPPQEPNPSRTMILAVATLSGFLVAFTMSAVNMALPLIEEEFDVSAVTLSWVSLSYMLVGAAVLLPAGRIADLYGRMRLFVWGMVVFTVISLASAFAPSVGVLIALRAIHGVGLAIGGATSTALVVLAYPPESRGRALGLNVAGVYLGLTLGPVLGGLIIHNLGWRGLFLVVGALGAPSVAIPLLKLRHMEWREPKRARFDVFGSILYAASLTAVLLGFSLLPDSLGFALVGVGLVGLVAFLWWETHAADPLLHTTLLRRNRVFAFSNAATFINYSATFAMVFLMSLYLQYNRGLDPQTAGFVLVTGTFVQAAFSPLAGRLTDRVQARYVASAGMAVCVLGLLGLSFAGETTPYWYVITMLCVLGLGYAFFSTPITHSIMSSVDIGLVGVASATLATVRQAGMSMSLGVATLVLALEVGRGAIRPADYPQVLSSVQLSFLIFTALCVLGVGASLVGPRRQDKG